MDGIKLSRTKADNFVINALVYQGYAHEKEELEIRTFIIGNHLSYYVQDTIYYEGKERPKITLLSKYNYIYLLREGLTLAGYDKPYVTPVIKEKEVSYKVDAIVSSYDYFKKSRKKKRR
jgi:hypothetical protein